ncbi:hypothetical protein LP52_15690 [Streptomonospora alba]|uniref:Uncharacterized protein n=1 Tax=Streptomonospora alba TaxID=183763 RepID=A0A0C2JMM9_9ACTN|nr:hypothetical protein [Streptomonospora alba]KIH98117.1 hypothetical protein LP52_15690 [Streptomonospora alba]
MRDLATDRDRLYQLDWFHRMLTRERGEGSINPQALDRLARQIADLTAKIAADADRGKDQREDIDDFARDFPDGPPDVAQARSFQPHRVPNGPFYRAADPVVLIQGAGAAALRADAEPLYCTGADAAGAQGELADALGSDQHMGSELQRLLFQSGELEPGKWQQPWTPLYLLWTADYHPVGIAEPDARVLNPDADSEEAGDGKWRFNSRVGRYTRRHTETPRSVRLRGRLPLSPHAVLTLADRTDDLARAHATSAAARTELENLRDSVRGSASGGDLLSQALDGFTDQLLAREAALTRRPRNELAAVLDGAWTHTPLGATIDPSSPDGAAVAQFHPLRSGYALLTELTLVDRHGRSVDLITRDTADRHGSVAVAESMRVSAGSETARNRFQLAPRLPQAARARFDPVAADDDRPLHPQDSASPVCGWVVPDHLNRSLLAHAPDGTLLGELYSTYPEDTAVAWRNRHGTGTGLPDELHPRFRALLTHLLYGRGARLDNLLTLIDDADSTIDPAHPAHGHGGLHAVGRPLALVRANLAIELERPPHVRPTPTNLAASPRNDTALDDRDWPVLLGSPESLDDGLIGYLLDTDADHFFAVQTPGGTRLRPEQQTFTVPAGELRLRATSAGTDTTLSLLVDPRAAVHATTDLLPTAQFPSLHRELTGALPRMEATFRVADLLTADLPFHHDTTALGMPVPTVEPGAWDWLDPLGTPSPILNPGTGPHPGTAPPTVRTGRLRVTFPHVAPTSADGGRTGLSS